MRHASISLVAFVFVSIHLSQTVLLPAAKHVAILPASAEEGGQQEGGNEGGGESGGGGEGGSQSGDAGGGGATHSHRGHDTHRLGAIAVFTAMRLYPGVLSPSSDRDPDVLTGEEQAFLCSMSRVRADSSAGRAWFAEFLAGLINRPLPMVRIAMLDDACGR